MNALQQKIKALTKWMHTLLALDPKAQQTENSL